MVKGHFQKRSMTLDECLDHWSSGANVASFNVKVASMLLYNVCMLQYTKSND